MKTVKTKKDKYIEYMNISESIDTTAFGAEPYFLVKGEQFGSEKYAFFSEKQLEDLIEGKLQRTSFDTLFLIKKEGLDLIEKYSFYNMDYFYGLKHEIKSSIKQHLFSKNPELDLLNPEFTLIQIIKNPNYFFAWKEMDGKIRSEPITIKGDSKSELHNSKYFLDELAEHLSQRNDISFLTHTGRWERSKSTLLDAPLKGDEPSIGGIISEIEHHLEENDPTPSDTEEMTILYYPTPENVEQLILFNCQIEGKKPENYEKRNYFVERYILNEILGAKAFLKAPIVEPIKVRKFKH